MTAPDGVLELEVTSLRKEADGVLSVTLADPQRRTLPAWEPGAHIDLGTEHVVRQYSLCGDPVDRQQYTVAVLREAASQGGSQYVHEALRPGELVEVGGPRNHFAFAPARRYVFIAGGIGITPFLPMIAAAESAGTPWQLTYGGRTASSMAFLDRLSAYPESVTICPQDQFGLLDLDAAIGAPDEGVAIYCCGPEPLLVAVEQRCAGWPAGALHLERFKAKPRDGDLGEERPFEIVVNSSGERILVAAGESALDALEDAGYRLANACRDGVCGSCETAVLAGVPEHRDSLIAADRVDVLMACVSRALTPELVLDL